MTCTDNKEANTSERKYLDLAVRGFREAMADGSVVRMREVLRKLLRNVSNESTLAQLILVAPDGRIACGILTPPWECDEEGGGVEMSRLLAQWELELLSQRIQTPNSADQERLEGLLESFRENPDATEVGGRDGKTFDQRLSEALVHDNNISGHVADLVRAMKVSLYWVALHCDGYFICRQKGKSVDWDGTDTPVYRVQFVHLNGATDGEELVSVDLGDLPVALGVDPGEANLQEEAECLIIAGRRWPALGSLPSMGGIVMFAFAAGESVEDGILEKQDSVRRYAWLVLYAAFVFQAYALSQASAEEPQRLREEFELAGMHELLRLVRPDQEDMTSMDDDALDRLITRVLSSESAFVARRTKRLLSALASPSSPVTESLRRVLGLVVNAFGPEQSRGQMDARNRLRGFLSAQQATIQQFPGVLNRMLFGVMMNAGLFSCVLNRGDQVDDLWSSIAAKWGQLFPDSPCEPSPLPGCASTWLPRAICAVEDLWADGTPASRKVSLRLLRAFIEHDGRTDEVVAERVFAALSFFLEDCTVDEEQVIRELLESAIQAISAFGMPLRHADKLYSHLKPEVQLQILNVLQPIEGPVFGQLQCLRAEKAAAAAAMDREEGSLGKLRLITIASAKGGVGKSSLGLALASGLADQNRGSRVCLVDLDMFGPTLSYAVEGNGFCWQHRYLNDLLWARYLPRHEATGASCESSDSQLSSVFAGREYWQKRFRDLASEQDDLLRQCIRPTRFDRLDILCCSPDLDHQGLMTPFIDSTDALGVLYDLLYDLVLELKSRDYVHVVFDTPAELKEVTRCAVQLSSLTGGANVFVSTSFQPALLPIIDDLSRTYYVGAENYLVWNKARALDKKYISDRQSFLDLLLANQGIDVKHQTFAWSSQTYGKLLNVAECFHMPWDESIERLLQSRGPISGAALQQMAKMAEGLARRVAWKD